MPDSSKSELLNSVAKVLGAVAAVITAIGGLVAVSDRAEDYRSPKVLRVEHPQEQCVWRGTAPICDGRCEAGEVEQKQCIGGGDSQCGQRCLIGHKALCCRVEKSPKASLFPGELLGDPEPAV